MITSALPLAFVIASIAALGITGNLWSSSPFVMAAQLAAVGLAVWARRSFQAGTFRVSAAPAGTAIIRRGPYRVLRHPMYAAALLFIWTAVVSHRSLLTFALGIAVTAVAITRVYAEERLLRAQYADYGDYMRATNALLPFVF